MLHIISLSFCVIVVDLFVSSSWFCHNVVSLSLIYNLNQQPIYTCHTMTVIKRPRLLWEKYPTSFSRNPSTTISLALANNCRLNCRKNFLYTGIPECMWLTVLCIWCTHTRRRLPGYNAGYIFVCYMNLGLSGFRFIRFEHSNLLLLYLRFMMEKVWWKPFILSCYFKNSENFPKKL